MCARKGFTVIPNFAGTAHMVQGQTLEAALADFLDLDTIPRPHGKLAAYIATSRVRQAEAFLIVRVFRKRSSRTGGYLGLTCSWG